METACIVYWSLTSRFRPQGPRCMVSTISTSVLSVVWSCKIFCCTSSICRSQWPHGLRRRSSAAPLLRSWVRIPPVAWMFFCCECCVLSGRGLCDGLITRPEESCRLWRVVVCDQDTSKTRRLKPPAGLWKIRPNGLWRQENNNLFYISSAY